MAGRKRATATTWPTCGTANGRARSTIFKNIIADEDGKVYALPFDEDKAMIVYNVDVFEKIRHY